MGVWNAIECWFLQRLVLGIRSSVGTLALPLYSNISLYIGEVEIWSWKKNLKPFSTLPLIQEGQLSVNGERLGTKYW